MAPKLVLPLIIAVVPVGTPGVVVAGVDPVAVDAYGTTLLNFKPQDIGHIKLAFASGVGEMRLDRIKVKHV